MEKFELICKGYMEGIEEYEETEWLYGENKADFELPLKKVYTMKEDYIAKHIKM